MDTLSPPNAVAVVWPYEVVQCPLLCLRDALVPARRVCGGGGGMDIRAQGAGPGAQGQGRNAAVPTQCTTHDVIADAPTLQPKYVLGEAVSGILGPMRAHSGIGHFHY